MSLLDVAVAKTQMLIRRPVADVFDAFVDPSITTNFWFTKSSGRLEAGRDLTWEWEMYGAVGHLHVKAVEENRRILIEWDDPATSVEWIFEPRSEKSTLVRITNWGFHGDEGQIVAQAIDSMGGFAYVLAGLKAYLEHGIKLNLIADHHPPAAED